MFNSSHFHFARVTISEDRGWRLRAPDSSVRKARCLYTRIVPRGQPGPRDGKERTGSGAGVNGDGDGAEAGTATGVEVNEGAQDGNGNGDGSGDGNESSSRDGNGDGNEDRIGEGGRAAK